VTERQGTYELHGSLERQVELYLGAVTTILKARVESLPAYEILEPTLRQLIGLGSSGEAFGIVIAISQCGTKGRPEWVEEWSLAIEPRALFVETWLTRFRDAPAKFYRFGDRTLFFQSLYNLVKRLSFDQKLQSGACSRKDGATCPDHEGVYFTATVRCPEGTELETGGTFNPPKVVIATSDAKTQEVAPYRCALSPIPSDFSCKLPYKPFPPSCTGKHFNEAFVGSYEESLLSGRMSTLPFKSIDGFLAKVSGFSGGCSPQFSLPFSASFYHHLTESFGPYVGTIALEPDFAPAFKIPLKGKLQVVIVNPSATAVQFFLVPYDLREMPLETKTFLRHRVHANKPGCASALRRALHVQFARRASGELFLYRCLRVVFPLRAIDDEGAIVAASVHHPPPAIRFTALASPFERDPFAPAHPAPILARAGDLDAYLGYQ
ncbi:hypothetical protein L0F63_005006, partial [Massospora cicadina]